jgi:hypothetical protein
MRSISPQNPQIARNLAVTSTLRMERVIGTIATGLQRRRPTTAESRRGAQAAAALANEAATVVIVEPERRTNGRHSSFYHFARQSQLSNGAIGQVLLAFLGGLTSKFLCGERKRSFETIVSACIKNNIYIAALSSIPPIPVQYDPRRKEKTNLQSRVSGPREGAQHPVQREKVQKRRAETK